MSKTAEAFRTISEVAGELDVPKHVLRFWEARFPQIRPMKRGGGRRYYRPEDMELLRGIRALLHAEGYTIRGVQKILREHGIDQVKAAARRAAQATAEGQLAARKRGRKAISGPAARTTPQPAAPAEQEIALPDRKSQVLAAIRELEIARAILMGRQANQLASSEEAKKGRAGGS